MAHDGGATIPERVLSLIATRHDAATGKIVQVVICMLPLPCYTSLADLSFYITDYYAYISLRHELINAQVSQYSLRNGKAAF